MINAMVPKEEFFFNDGNTMLTYTLVDCTFEMMALQSKIW